MNQKTKSQILIFGMGRSEINMEKSKLNIYEKLIEVRKTVEYIEKGESGHNFKYAGSSEIIAKIRPAMDGLGLLLVPNIESFEMIQVQKGAVINTVPKVVMSFTWINAENPSEQLKTSYTYFEDRITGCQALGSIQTYAERYFLYKFFQVATDKDSPEQFYKNNGWANKVGEKDYAPEKSEKDEPERIVGYAISDDEIKQFVDEMKDILGNKIDEQKSVLWMMKCREATKAKPDTLKKKMDEWKSDPTKILEPYDKFMASEKAKKQ